MMDRSKNRNTRFSAHTQDSVLCNQSNTPQCWATVVLLSWGSLFSLEELQSRWLILSSYSSIYGFFFSTFAICMFIYEPGASTVLRKIWHQRSPCVRYFSAVDEIYLMVKMSDESPALTWASSTNIVFVYGASHVYFPVYACFENLTSLHLLIVIMER